MRPMTSMTGERIKDGSSYVFGLKDELMLQRADIANAPHMQKGLQGTTCCMLAQS